jgi:hypothetical protein
VRSAAQRTQLGTDVVKALHTAFFAPGGGSGGSAAATLFVTHAASHFAALGSPERSQLKLMRIITAALRSAAAAAGPAASAEDAGASADADAVTVA